MKRITTLVFACIAGLSSVALISCSKEDNLIGGCSSSSDCELDTNPDILINVYTTNEHVTTISYRTDCSLSLEMGVEYVFGCEVLYQPKSCDCSQFIITNDETIFEYDTEYLLITDSKRYVDKVHYYYVSALAPVKNTMLSAYLAIAPLEINVSISGTSVDTTDDSSEIVTNDDDEMTIE